MSKVIKIKPSVYFVAVIAAMGGLVFGIEIGSTGGTLGMPSLIKFGKEAKLEEALFKGLISSMFTIGALIGALGSSLISDTFGLKISIILSCGVLIAGTILQIWSPYVSVLLIGRVIGGIGIGSSSTLVPNYQTSIAPVSIRGKLVSLQQLCVTFGIVLGGLIAFAITHFVKDDKNPWRYCYGVKLPFAVAMFIAFLFLKESPRWLISKGRTEEARKSLTLIRYPSTIEEEIKSLKDEVNKDLAEGSGTWGDVFSNRDNMFYRLMVGCGCQFFQQVSGINAIFFYSGVILQHLPGNSQVIGSTVINFVNFLATFVCLFFIEKFGRIVLLLTGGIGMFLSIVISAILSTNIPPNLNKNNTNYAAQVETTKPFLIGTATLLSIYVAFFAYSWGPIAWIICSEIYPKRLQAKSTALATATNWGVGTVVLILTPMLMTSPAIKSSVGTFLIFGCFIFLSLIFTYLFIPETAGCNSTEITQLFKDFKPGFRSLSRKKKFQLSPEEEGVEENIEENKDEF